MKFIKIFLAVIVILIAIFFIGSLFLPKTFSISRSTEIAAKDSVIYHNIADFNQFIQWNPWSKLEPSAHVIISGLPREVGHMYQWEGKEMGSGQMEITETTPFSDIKMELRFIKPFKSIANTSFNIRQEGESCQVTWTMDGHNNIFSKWMGVFVSMDKMLGKDFENGLQWLKEKSELEENSHKK